MLPIVKRMIDRFVESGKQIMVIERERERPVVPVLVIRSINKRSIEVMEEHFPVEWD